MKSILFFFLAICSFSQAQDSLEIATFQKEANLKGMTFVMPEGYTVTPIKENGDLYYSFAVINEDKTMEIRYTIWGLVDDFEEYEKSLEDSTMTMISPNNYHMGRFQSNGLNMTGGNMPNIGPFPPQAVMKEFGADLGGSSFFEFNCEFGEGYKYGQAIYLHKDNVADVVITFMSHDQETHSDLMMAGFHSLTFK